LLTWTGNVTSLELESTLSGPLGTPGSFVQRQLLYQCTTAKADIERTFFHTSQFLDAPTVTKMLSCMVAIVRQGLMLPTSVDASKTEMTTSSHGDVHVDPDHTAQAEDEDEAEAQPTIQEIDAVLLLQWALEMLRANHTRLSQLWKAVEGI
jgi:hypothetical protein